MVEIGVERKKGGGGGVSRGGESVTVKKYWQMDAVSSSTVKMKSSPKKPPITYLTFLDIRFNKYRDIHQ